MKNTLLTLLFLSLLMSCNTNDDDFYNTQTTSIPNLVTVEISSTGYNVGDYIYINSIINRIQTEANQSTPLDIRKSTGNASSLSFNYVLERKIDATTWETVDATSSNLNLTKGQFLNGDYYTADALFNSLSDAYEFRAGIKLNTAGDYRITFINSSGANQVELRSNSSESNIVLNINSTTNTANGSSYNFTVL